MNLNNLAKLKAWLDDGAPEAILDMNEYFAPSPVWQEEADEVFMEITLEHQGKNIGDCGSVCCIAGAAAQMSRTEDGSFPKKPIGFLSWDQTRDVALAWLGLPDSATNDRFMGHDLFDPDLAPTYCTPTQASAAVGRVMRGEEPWRAI